jgi:hypothetical protein
MYQGKNDMPCSNTLAEIEYDGGGSYTPEEEGRLNQLKTEMALEKLASDEDPTFFWDAIVELSSYCEDSSLKMLIIKGDDDSLLKAGRLIRQSAIEYAESCISDDAWLEAFNQENAEF